MVIVMLVMLHAIDGGIYDMVIVVGNLQYPFV